MRVCAWHMLSNSNHERNISLNTLLLLLFKYDDRIGLGNTLYKIINYFDNFLYYT